MISAVRSANASNSGSLGGGVDVRGEFGWSSFESGIERLSLFTIALTAGGFNHTLAETFRPLPVADEVRKWDRGLVWIYLLCSRLC